MFTAENQHPERCSRCHPGPLSVSGTRLSAARSVDGQVPLEALLSAGQLPQPSSWPSPRNEGQLSAKDHCEGTNA